MMSCYTPAHQWMQKLASREVSPAEILAQYRQRIQVAEPMVKGFLTLFDQAVTNPDAPADLALPIALKDNICLADHPTTCASQILRNFVPPYHATVTEKLLSRGIPIIGKANMDEFGMGSSNENSSFHLTTNPWDPARVPGGSSGGPAALVAAGEVPWSLGTDTGGSIRLPAAFCGIVGLKPTYGLVSRYGLVAFASSLDQIGPLTQDVRDSALLLNQIAGEDARDSTCLTEPIPDYTLFLEQGVQGLRIGLPREMFGPGIDAEVRAAVMAAIRVLENQGARVEETELPTSDYALAAYYLIATSEASSNLARYDGIRYGVRSPQARTLEEAMVLSRSHGLGTEVKRRIMLGTYALSSGYYEAYYQKAQQARTLLIEDFRRTFEKFDLLLAPTAPTTAFRLGEKAADPLSMYLTDILTVTVNLAGIPAMSLPCGFDAQGMPIGLQILGPPLGEAQILRAAYAYEQSTSWHHQHPNI